MAELLGLVASAITVVEVAGKVATTTLALKKLWSEVKDVPETITALLQQLEILHPVLEDMESQFADTRNLVRNDKTAKLSLNYCQRAVTDMERLVKDMSQQISSTRKSKRVVAKVKVTIKKGIIVSYQERLKGALQLLSLAQQSYMIALMKLQPSVIVSELRSAGSFLVVDEKEPSLDIEKKRSSSKSAHISHSNSDRNSSSNTTQIPWLKAGLLGRVTWSISGEQEQESPSPFIVEQVWKIRLQMPYWLAQKAWDFQAWKAMSGWTAQLTPWSVRPSWDPIFACAGFRSTTVLLKELGSRNASLFDRTPSGETLLHLAAKGGNAENFKLLVKMGLSLDEQSDNSAAPAFVIGTFHQFTRDSTKKLANVLDLYRFLISEDALDENHIFPDSDGGFTHPVWRLPGLLDLLTKTPGSSLRHGAISLEVKVRKWDDVNPKVLLDAVRHKKLVSPAAFRAQLDCWTYGKNSLFDFCLHYFRMSIPMLFQHVIVTDEPEEDWQLSTSFTDWRLLTRWLFSRDSLEQTNSVAEVLANDNTNLVLIARLAFQDSLDGPFNINLRPIVATMRWWLEDLLAAGMDLEDYGNHQMSVFKSSGEWTTPRRWNSKFLDYYEEPHREKWGGPILASFTYGPRPEDWDFVFDHRTEDYAGDFWMLVEDLLPSVPGAWVDDDDGDDDE